MNRREVRLSATDTGTTHCTAANYCN
jgi:hypothetical protein